MATTHSCKTKDQQTTALPSGAMQTTFAIAPPKGGYMSVRSQPKLTGLLQLLAPQHYQQTWLNADLVVHENNQLQSRKLKILMHLKSHILSRCPTHFQYRLLLHLQQPSASIQHPCHPQFIGVISIPWLTLLWTPNMYLLRLTGLHRHSDLTNMFHHLKLLHFLAIAIYLWLLRQIFTKLASMCKLLHLQLDNFGQFHHQILALTVHHVQGHTAHFGVQQLKQPGLECIRRLMMWRPFLKRQGPTGPVFSASMSSELQDLPLSLK